MPDDQKVSADEILRSEGAGKPVTGGTFLQRTGLLLAGFVGGVASVVILALVGKWVFYAPAVPPGVDQNTAKAILDNFRTLQQIALEPFTSLFDSGGRESASPGLHEHSRIYLWIADE